MLALLSITQQTVSQNNFLCLEPPFPLFERHLRVSCFFRFGCSYIVCLAFVDCLQNDRLSDAKRTETPLAESIFRLHLSLSLTLCLKWLCTLTVSPCARMERYIYIYIPLTLEICLTRTFLSRCYRCSIAVWIFCQNVTIVACFFAVRLILTPSIFCLESQKVRIGLMSTLVIVVVWRDFLVECHWVILSWVQLVLTFFYFISLNLRCVPLWLILFITKQG